MVQLFRPSTSRPVFIAHPVPSSSGPSTALVSPQSSRCFEQRYIASDFQTANGRSQSLTSPTSACADGFSARVPLGHFPRPTRDRDTRPDGLGHLTMTVHQAAQLGNPSRPNIYARTAHLAKIDSSPSAAAIQAIIIPTSTPGAA